MSDANDTKVAFEQRTRKQQDSIESYAELIANALNRVAMDGSRDQDVMAFLQSMSMSLAVLGILPSQSTAIVTQADAEIYTLVKCNPNQRIIVFDILLSINAASDITFLDDDDNDALATMYAPNAGQGFTMNSVRGKYLKRGHALRVQSTNAVNYSIDCSYAIIEDPLK